MIRVLTYCLLLIGFSHNAPAQGKIQVLTKTITREIAWEKDDAIMVQGEKASIEINTWSRQEVKIVMKLISRALDKKVAETELEYQRYILQKNKDGIFIKNYFVLPENTRKMQAILSARFEVWIPVQASLNCTNSYGSVKITNKTGQTSLDTRYTNVALVNVQGTGRFKSYFGDLQGMNVGGEIVLDLDHTKTSFRDVSGAISIVSKLGDIEVEDPGRLLSLDIDASKSDVFLKLGELDQYQFDFAVDLGEIYTPVSSLEGPARNWLYGSTSSPMIKVRTYLGKITLEE